MVPTWITREISSGLQKLVLLSLERTPAMDVISRGTLPAWAEAITYGREFDEERDAPRFRAAFVRLQATCTHWPAPRDFIDALPGPKSVVQSKRIGSDAARDVGMRSIRKIYEMLELGDFQHPGE